MKKVSQKFSFLFTKEKIKIYIYTCSQLLGFLLAFLTNLFFTKYADPTGYGEYRYATNFLLTIPTFFAFGIPFCCSRLIARDSSNEKHKVLTAGFYVTSILSILVSIGLFIASLTGKFDKLGRVQMVFPFIIIFALKNLFIQVYQGTGKTNRYAVFTLAQNVIVLIGIFVGNKIYGELPFNWCVTVFILSNAITMIPIMSRMTFRTDRESFGTLVSEIKLNGIQMYFSSIITTSASSLIALICGSQYGFAEYGYYSLALSFARCFTLISSAMTVVKFRENVKQRFIKKSDMVFMAVLNAIIYGIFIIFGKPIFFIFFSKEYAIAYDYLVVLGLAYLFDGMTLYFNRFFIARGRGDMVVKNSIIASVVNIAVSVALIPKFEIKGLVASTVISAAYNLLQYIVTYLVYRKKEIEKINLQEK